LVEEGVRAESEAVKKLREAAEKKGWKMGGEPPEEDGPPPAHPIGPAHRSLGSAHEDRVAAASQEVDLRGLTGDEAVAALVRAVDDAIVVELASLRVIHGKGTGALRARVAEVLKRDGRVSRFALAPMQQGGSGVTIVEFK
jgi:dsDNA-specific endonuclease/ATPase MutS2